MSTTQVTDEQLAKAWDDPRLANEIYHNWEADTYDDKWCISYDDRCVAYTKGRFEHVAGVSDTPYGRTLEIGGGTGFFSLNLALGGVIEEVHITDLSPKMVEVALRNGRNLDLDVHGQAVDAEHLPYPDEYFDLVCGHAVLHHIVDLDQAMREIMRVLKPGGKFVFAGEPTSRGDYVARKLSGWTWSAATALTRRGPLAAKYGKPDEEIAESEKEARLEAVVDVHTFEPEDLLRLALRAGATDVSVVTDELTASWFGWPVRTIEAAVQPTALGFKWYQTVYRSWLGLNYLDERVWSRVVPKRYFYNVSVAGTKHGA